MNPILLGIMAGIAGTLVVDAMNYLLSRGGLLLKIDIRMIGRMLAGWSRGRFRYQHPQEMQESGGEWVLGWITHYAISVMFALIYVLGWHFLFGRRSPHGLRAPLSSLANHTFFGIGMALVIALL